MDSPIKDTLSRRGSSLATSATGFAQDDGAIGDMDVDLDSGASMIGGKGNVEGTPGHEDDGLLKPNLDAAPDFGERSYFYGERLPEAPNPCLNIEGLGLIGFPLGTRDAKAIIDASSSEGHRVPGSGIWELEGAKVKFDDPAWVAPMEAVLGKACQVLGVKTSLSPRCERSKHSSGLSLREAPAAKQKEDMEDNRQEASQDIQRD